MTPVILLTGKNGQVGGELLRHLPRLGKVVALDRSQMDLSRPAEICRTIRDVRPQIIINTAAYTAVDQAEADPRTTRAVNAEAPRVIAEVAKEIGAAVVHYSTDYVFDGLKETPYDETDPPHPINVYGQTKLEGEEAIRAVEIPYLIFRTEWVYGVRAWNFMLTILRLATEREELKVVSDQIGTPTSSREIALTTVRILSNLINRSDSARWPSEVSGTYHMTAAGETSRYDFAKAILAEATLISPNIRWFADATSCRPLIARRIVPITTAEYSTPACRPAYSVLSNSLLAQTFGVKMEDWQVQLRRCFSAEYGVNQFDAGFVPRV